jgi:hypothetical protein
MHVVRYLIASIAAIAVLSWASITYYPAANFIPFVPTVIGAGFVALIAIAAFSMWKENELNERGKTILMSLMLVAILVPSIYTMVAYTHIVATSWSDGEVHWHADYEVIVQNEDSEYEQLDLVDPSQFCKKSQHESAYMCTLNDRTGAVEYHEHNDRRIHLEGTFKHREDATLSAFFRTFGGELTNEKLVYPTNDKTYEVEEGDGKSLKIVMQTGVGGDRHWCAIGENVPSEDQCRSQDNGEPATSPQEYVISPIQRGPIDLIFLVYDDASVEQVLQDLREDGEYREFGVVKGGEGY